MEAKRRSIEEVRSKLDKIRQNPCTRHKFPKELWISIIQLTKTHSTREVCRELQMNHTHLERKIHQLKKPAQSELEFREISMPIIQLALDTVTIELKSADGMQAKIQGSSSCLNYLIQLFGR